ncbi:UNVERIFIED_CONTAM: hypothetical protein NCL1_28998 [Trichonephila clavipes]
MRQWGYAFSRKKEQKSMRNHGVDADLIHVFSSVIAETVVSASLWEIPRHVFVRKVFLSTISSVNGNNTTKAKINLCEVFGEETVTARTCQRKLVNFCLGVFSLKDEPKSLQSSDVSDEMLRSMIRINSTLTSLEVAFKLGIRQTIALD